MWSVKRRNAGLGKNKLKKTKQQKRRQKGEKAVHKSEELGYQDLESHFELWFYPEVHNVIDNCLSHAALCMSAASLRWWMLSQKGGRTRMQTAISDMSPASGQQHYLRALEEFIAFLNCWYKNNHHFWRSLEWECTLDLNTIHLRLLQFQHECAHCEESYSSREASKSLPSNSVFKSNKQRNTCRQSY